MSNSVGLSRSSLDLELHVCLPGPPSATAELPCPTRHTDRIQRELVASTLALLQRFKDDWSCALL